MTRLWQHDWSRAQTRYGLVILLILVTYGLSVASLGQRWAAAVLFVQMLTVWVVFTASESRRAQRVAGFALVAVAALSVTGFLAGSGSEMPLWLYQVILAFSVLLYLVAPLVVGRHLFRRRVIDLQTLLGAISAYLLVGMMFGFAYLLVGSLQSVPFFGVQGKGNLAEDLFFSFSTLTTTGYGNLVPATNPGQSMAILEAILGQLILIIAVAKIVTDWTPAPHARLSGSTGPEEEQ